MAIQITLPKAQEEGTLGGSFASLSFYSVACNY